MSGSAAHIGRWRDTVPTGERDRIDGRYRELLDELAGVGMPCPPVDPDVIDGIADHRRVG